MIDTDTLEELKIIAQDGDRLDSRDRQIISQAAIQLEVMEAMLLNANQALMSSTKALIEGKSTMQAVHAQLESFQNWPRSNYGRVTLTLGITL